MRTVCIAVIVCLTCSCTVHTGPFKIAEFGKKSAPAETKRESLPPPDVTGDIVLEFVELFGVDAGLRSPWGLSFGVNGTLYVCDRDRSTVVRLGSDGRVMSRFSGSSSRVERLYSPIDVCSTAGMAIYAIDATNSRILRFDRNLKNSFVIYKKDDDNNLFGTFNGLAFDKASGDLYVTDRDTGSLIRIDMLGGSITNRGSFGSAKESFREPAGLDVSSGGVIYIADKRAGTVSALDHFGATIRSIGSESLREPVDVAILSDGMIAVADRDGIVILSDKGAALGAAGFGVDRTMTPRAVAALEDRIYISDAESGNILVYRIKR